MGPLVRGGLIGLLAFGPLAFGAVEIWAYSILEIGVFGLAAVWIWARRTQSLGSGGVGAWLLFGPMALFAVLVVIQLALTGTAYPHATVQALLLLAAYAGAAWLATDAFRSDRATQGLVVALIVIGFGMAVFGIIQKYSGNGRIYWLRSLTQGGDFFGPYVNRNHFAGWMAMIVPVGLGYTVGRFGAAPAVGRTFARRLVSRMAATDFNKLVVLLFMLAVMTAALFLALSRGGALAVLSGLAVMAVLVFLRPSTRSWGRWILATAIAAALAVGWFGVGPVLHKLASLGDPKTALASRADVWQDSLKIVADYPVMGSGLGTYEAVFPAYRTGTDQSGYAHAHNDYVQLAAETGWLGLGIAIGGAAAFLAFALVSLRRSGLPPWRRGLVIGGVGAVVAIAVHSALDFNLHLPANAVTLFAVLGALWSASRNQEARPGPRVSIVTAILVSLGLLGLAGAATAQFVSDRYYQAGLRLESRGDLSAAVERYDLASKWMDADVRPHLAQGRLLQALSDREETQPMARALALEGARYHLDQAVERAPTLAEARLYRGWVNAVLGKRLGAESDFAAVLRLDPTNAKAWYYVGMWFAASDRANPAREFADKLRAIGRASEAAEIEARLKG